MTEGVTVPVSVNVGSRSLHDRSLPHAIDRLLVSANLSPELLIVEVAEGTSLDHADVLDVLTRLRIRGIGVALDNFGHGQASTLRLQRLPLTEIKIDRNIVRALPNGGVARAVVDFAVRLGRDLKIRTTAVGVENPEQLETLKDLGCDACQGHHLCRPLEPAALMPWIRDHAPTAPPPAGTATTAEQRA
jgi:EAL domain-containing protein (putative c-di-GMP-specific phosphodiesterase class I)